MSSSFVPGDLALLRTEEEIEIETSSAAGATHRTIIWVVVDDHDRVLIRSYLGSGARWFREISQRPAGRVHVRGHALDIRAVPATDDERVSACSDGFARKYAGQHSVRSMVTRYLETTLELVPR
jgi:hypothetical protein